MRFWTTGLLHLDGAVIVAMVAMRVVQVAVYEVVGVVAVRDGLVTACGTVLMLGVVAAAVVLRRAGVGVCGRNGESMFLDAGGAGMMEVAVVNLVGVAVVLDCRVAAPGTMLMSVIRMNVSHVSRSFLRFGREIRVQFPGVVQRIQDEIGDVPIREGVEQMIPRSPSAQEAFASENSQPL